MAKILARIIEEIPQDGDIFDIVIIPEIVQGARDGHLVAVQNLRNAISQYLQKLSTLAEAKVIPYPAYPETQKGKVSYYHPFHILGPDGEVYPEGAESRRYKIRITYPLTSTGTEHVVNLHKGEDLSDFYTIFISDSAKQLKDAEARAKAFIDSKIAEVYDSFE